MSRVRVLPETLSVILMSRRYSPSANDASGTVMPPGTGNFAGSNCGGRLVALTVCGLVLLKNFSRVAFLLVELVFEGQVRLAGRVEAGVVDLEEDRQLFALLEFHVRRGQQFLRAEHERTLARFVGADRARSAC